MRTKRLVIMVLCAVNVLLLAVLVFIGVDPPRAHAQRGRQANFTAVTTEYETGLDAVWLLKSSTGDLAVMVPNQQDGRLRLAGSRNINDDL